jgi:hypothetical protein
MGEDLFSMRKMVREKFTASIKERQLEVPTTVRGRLSEAPLKPSSSSVIQDK